MTNEAMIAPAEEFFAACEAGKGWVGVRSIARRMRLSGHRRSHWQESQYYTDWVKGAIGIFPDGRSELMAFAVDEARRKVVVAAVFHATHTGEGGPVPPTGESMATDYVYVMEFTGGKISGVTTVWNSGLAMKAIG